MQLLLLYSDSTYNVLTDRHSEPKLLSDQMLDGRTYSRVQIDSDIGAVTFWIDKETLLLHRMEYPLKALRAELEKQGGPVEHLEQYVDFGTPRIDQELPKETFVYEVPPGAIDRKTIVERATADSPFAVAR